VRIIIKGNNNSYSFPCFDAAAVLDENLGPTMKLMDITGDVRSDLIEKYSPEPHVFLPSRTSHKSMSKAHEAAYRALYSLVQYPKSCDSIRKDLLISASAESDDDSQSALDINVPLSMLQCEAKIRELEEKEEDEQTVDEKKLLYFAHTKKRNEAASAASSGAASQRVTATPVLQRGPTAMLVLLSRFVPLIGMKQLVVLDLCSGAGSMARALAKPLFKTMGIRTGCLSVELSPVVQFLAKNSFQKECEQHCKTEMNEEKLQSVQQQSQFAAYGRGQISSGAKVCSFTARPRSNGFSRCRK
jgi:hypothetical protein